jgi:hypothetical protein
VHAPGLLITTWDMQLRSSFGLAPNEI